MLRLCDLIDFYLSESFSALTFINAEEPPQGVTSVEIEGFFYSSSSDILEETIKLAHELQELRKIGLFARRFKLDSAQVIEVIFSFYSASAAAVSSVAISSMPKGKGRHTRNSKRRLSLPRYLHEWMTNPTAVVKAIKRLTDLSKEFDCTYAFSATAGNFPPGS